MDTTCQQLESAAMCLARSGSIKDRLAEAFRDHLAKVNADDLPEPLRAQFRACHDALTRERPQRGEDAVRATVRKMSNLEADELSCNLVRLYAALVRESQRTAEVVTTLNSGAAGPARPKKVVPQVVELYAQEA
jgi:hypothetical protein